MKKHSRRPARANFLFSVRLLSSKARRQPRRLKQKEMDKSAGYGASRYSNRTRRLGRNTVPPAQARTIEMNYSAGGKTIGQWRPGIEVKSAAASLSQKRSGSTTKSLDRKWRQINNSFGLTVGERKAVRQSRPRERRGRR